MLQFPLEDLWGPAFLKNNLKYFDHCNYFVMLAESYYNVKYWNVNYYVKYLSENCWFLVCYFFSVIWNIFQVNVFKTKLKCQNDCFGKLFLKSGNTSVYFVCFHYRNLSDEHLTWYLMFSTRLCKRTPLLKLLPIFL